jgi:hypothetical protein
MATVSMPITWDDIEKDITITNYRLDNVLISSKHPEISGGRYLAESDLILRDRVAWESSMRQDPTSPVAAIRHLKDAPFPHLHLSAYFTSSVESRRADYIPPGSN